MQRHYRSVETGRHADSNNDQKMKMSATMWHILFLVVCSELSAGTTNIFTHFFFIFFFLLWVEFAVGKMSHNDLVNYMHFFASVHFTDR